jgi:carbon storage regulator
MLVLSRKPGEQIVLPELDITVTVLGISGKRVRVGIAAPPQISIQRHEIRDRVCERMVPPKKSEIASGAMALVQLPADLGDILARSIARRTANQIGSLHVETAEDRVIIHGRARSYHTRQLAQEAVMEALKASSSCRPEDVEYRIEMVTDRAPRKLTG